MHRLVTVRLWSRVQIDINGCWMWQGNRDANGYGRIRHNGRLSLAHRVSYELFIGPILP